MHPRVWWRKFWRITVGTIVILAGVVMLVTPGPGIVAIIAGLAIMADEFPPARRALDWMKHRYEDAKDVVLEKAGKKPGPTSGPGTPPPTAPVD